MGEGVRKAGVVQELLWRSDEMEQGQVCPYKVLLDEGGITWAPADDDELIRREVKGAGGASKKRKVS